MQGVLVLTDSFTLLVRVSMRKSTWEEKAVNHQSTEWPVALVLFASAKSSVDFPMSESGGMWGSCVRGFLTCISPFVCLFPVVREVACQCTHAAYACVCV